MKKIILVIFIVLAAMIFTLGCSPSGSYQKEEAGKDTGDKLLDIIESDHEKNETEIDTNEDEAPIPQGQSFGYNPLVDGLHVTGNPVEVDIEKYRLEVFGEVETLLSLTFDEIKDMESTRIFAELICPDTFKDEGYWTGVSVDNLLKLAEVKEGAAEVHFISLDGVYRKSLKIEEVTGNEDLLIAYHFNDKEFPEIHGYPLRIVAKDYPGYLWVKWLGKIEITKESG
jgi:DMSO/TMAO reductase YedYZ molybdopterin-dependent catalytic subunit